MFERLFIRFLAAGGIAAAANFGSRFLFSMIVDYWLAITLAYLVGMTVAFILMRGQVFNASDGSLFPQITKFILVNLVALLQTLVISLMLAHWIFPAVGITEYAEGLAHLIGVLVPVVTSYFGHKMFTFGHANDELIQTSSPS